MTAEYISCWMTSQIFLLLRQPNKKDGLLRQPITYYEIAKRTHDFVMTYVVNRKINMTLVILLLVSNKKRKNMYETRKNRRGGGNLLYPVPRIFFDVFFLIKSVCRNVETKGKVFWK